jgi:hypothetical protein
MFLSNIPTVVMYINVLYTCQVLNTSILILLESRNATFKDMFLFKKTYENHLLKK